jgi:hypothetical protein
MTQSSQIFAHSNASTNNHHIDHKEYNDGQIGYRPHYYDDMKIEQYNGQSTNDSNEDDVSNKNAICLSQHTMFLFSIGTSTTIPSARKQGSSNCF